MIEEILDIRGADPRIRAFLRSIADPGALADTSGYSPDLTYEQKRELLETLDVTERLEKAVAMQRERLAELQIRRRIRDDVQEGAEAQQREYLLRKQMESIRKELGEDEGSVVEEYRDEDRGGRDARRGARAGRARAGPARAHGRVLRRVVDDPHLPRLADRGAMGEVAPTSGSTPCNAREVLDADHAGLEDVKDRITEYIAVRRLREERGVEDEGRGAGAILDADRPARHRQDVDRRVDRPRDRARVRPHVAGRRARRG